MAYGQILGQTQDLSQYVTDSQLTSTLSSYATQSWVTSLLNGSPIIETGNFQGGGYSASSPLRIQFSFTPVFWFIYSRTGAKSDFDAIWNTFLGFPWGVNDTLASPRVKYDTRNNRVSLWGPDGYAFDTNYYWYYCGIGIKS